MINLVCGVSAGSWSLLEVMGTLSEFNATMRALGFDGLVVVFGVMRSFGYGVLNKNLGSLCLPKVCLYVIDVVVRINVIILR